jgi:hypothetical protein
VPRSRARFKNAAGHGAGEGPLPVKDVRYGVMKAAREAKSVEGKLQMQENSPWGEGKWSISVYIIVIIE